MRLFVYGTLMKGEENHHLLERSPFLGTVATVSAFTLVDTGAYPGLVPGGAHAVAGEIYEVDPHTLATLDVFEGYPTLFYRSSIWLADRSEAQAYLLTPPRPPGARVIPGGNWRLR